MSATERELELLVRAGASLTRQHRAAKKLRDVRARVLAAFSVCDRYRHMSAPTAEREKLRALEEWFKVSSTALGMDSGPGR